LATEISLFRFSYCKSAKRFQAEKIHAKLPEPDFLSVTKNSATDSALYIKPPGYRRFGNPAFSKSKNALCHFAKVRRFLQPGQDDHFNKALKYISFVFRAHLATDLQ